MKPLAVITGASSGIGAGYARLLAARGYDLILVARRVDRLTALQTELTAHHGSHVEVLPADLTDEADLVRVEQRLRTAHGLHLLINNAGIDHLGDFAAVPLDIHLRMLKLHMEAAIRLCHAAVPILRQQQRGGIINVASLGGLGPLPQNALYCATKAGLIMFSRVLAVEEQPHHIAVQALCPGYTDTEIFATPGFAGFRPQRIPRFLWQSVDTVVRESLDRLRLGKTVVIPGIANRLLYLGIILNPFGDRINRRVWAWLYPR